MLRFRRFKRPRKKEVFYGQKRDEYRDDAWHDILHSMSFDWCAVYRLQCSAVTSFSTITPYGGIFGRLISLSRYSNVLLS